MKTKLTTLFLSFVLVFIVSACAGAATPTDTPVNNATKISATATIISNVATSTPGKEQPVYTNNGTVDICKLFLSHVGKNDWGPNQLADGVKIAAGEKYTITNVTAGLYNVKAIDCDGTSLAVVQLEIK